MDDILSTGFAVWDNGCSGTDAFKNQAARSKQRLCGLPLLWGPQRQDECELREKCLAL